MQAFLNVGDAHRKLSRSLITYNGKLYQCQASQARIGENLTNIMTLVPLDGSQNIKVDYTDNGFQAISYELGFMNKRNLECMYITRAPVRHSTVGIDLDNLQFIRPTSRNVQHMSYLTAYTKDFEDMIFNKYPSFADALKVVMKTKKNGAGVAFNKYYALVHQLDEEDESQVCLYHMNMTRLGRLNKETMKFNTNNRTRQQMLAMTAKTGMIPHEFF